jgi:hypothetical protein
MSFGGAGEAGQPGGVTQKGDGSIRRQQGDRTAFLDGPNCGEFKHGVRPAFGADQDHVAVHEAARKTELSAIPGPGKIEDQLILEIREWFGRAAV